MDNAKVGKLIFQLRNEKGLTQQNLADMMNISNKTVSKWERGLGCPDVSLWNELSEILGADIRNMLEGELTPNTRDIGKIDKVKFYVCQSCGNILMSTGKASVFCCGRTLAPLTPKVPETGLEVTAERIDADYYISFNHPMHKEHYISFIAYVKWDQVIFNRLYPEQPSETRLPPVNLSGNLYTYCSEHGLQVFPLSALFQ